MDVGISSSVSASLYMNQAQTAEQAQMQVFKEALDTQADQWPLPILARSQI